MTISTLASSYKLTKTEYQYYKYVFEMDKLQEKLEKMNSRIFSLEFRKNNSTFRRIQSEISLIEYEKNCSNLNIIKEYAGDIKKHKIKYKLFPSKRIKRKKQYENDIQKNSIIFDSQINVLKDCNKKALEDEQQENEKINKQIRLLSIQRISIEHQMEFLRKEYYGDSFFEEKTNSKIKRKA